MALNKLNPEQIKAILKGEDRGNIRINLLYLSIGAFRPDQIDCSPEEYEMYVEQAKSKVEELKAIGDWSI